MQLDKDTLRKLRGLIIFTLVILVGLWRFSIVLQAVKTILHILFPFLLGGAIAFVLSVPMNRIRKRLFANAKEKQKKFAAPVSLILTLIFVLALLSLVTIVVVPELGNTIATLGKTLPEKVPILMKKAEQLVSNHPELVDYIDEVQAQLNWEEILNQLVTFFRIGANSMLSSTISVATGIVSGVGTFFIGLVFACYILLQQEFLKRQMKKLILSVEAGAITLTDSEAAELEADAEAGAIRFSGSITDRVDADAELGNIVLKLSQSKDDFDYEIDSDLGNVEFDGISVENSVICNKASGKMNLDSSMGNIEIYFEQD